VKALQASATLTIRQKFPFGDFTCWPVCPFDGGGNDMPPQNPDAEKQHRVSRELRGIACDERCSETKHDIHNSG
jgi:hypothetical protein